MDPGIRYLTRLAVLLGMLTLVVLNVHHASAAVTVDGLENQIIARTNVERQKHGLAPLGSERLLAKAALGHSEEMIRLDYFSHESPTPSQHTVSDRVFATGSTEVEVGENIAFYEGYTLDQIADRVVRDWMNSPGHRANILRKSYNLIGVGVYGNGIRTMATQVFGARHLSLQPVRPSTEGHFVVVRIAGHVIDRSTEVGIFDEGVPLHRARVTADSAFSAAVRLRSGSGLHRLNVGPLSRKSTANAYFSITNIIPVDTSAIATR